MSWSVRCRHQACRVRKVFAKHPDEYEKVQPCDSCGHTKGWRVEDRRYNKRQADGSALCRCEGPEVGQEHGKNYPHRTTHPLCDQHPEGFKNQARARGVSEEDIVLEFGGEKMKETDDVPF